MSRQKRQPANTTKEVSKAFMNAAQDFAPPEHIHLRERDLPFWRSIVMARPISDWTDSDLETAANLARCKADIERLQQQIDDQGDIIDNKRGTPIVNPRHTLLETLSRRMVALSRMLHVHAEATSGESRDNRKTSKAQRTAKKILEQTDDGLIPRGSVN